MMKFVPAAISRQVAHGTLLASKSSPELLFAAGIVGMVGSTVLACRATLKADVILTEAKEKVDLAKNLEHDDYSEMDRKKDLALVRYQTGVKLVRAYAPAIVVGGLSIAALTSSHSILTKRNAGLAAAYAALDKGFREYRARVVSKYGPEVDQELRYGVREITTEDPETKEKKTVVRVGPGGESIYARFFDSHSPRWSKEPEYNLIFLKAEQNYCNDILISRGHLFLNEVYARLGLPHTKAGAVVGWLHQKHHPHSDNYVSFGVFEGQTMKARDFVNGFEGSILLDFNVDGVIYDKIDNPGERLSWQLNP
jgi:Family of unknown function (DUF6353)